MMTIDSENLISNQDAQKVLKKINDITHIALENVIAAEQKPGDWFCEYPIKVPASFIPYKDFAFYGRALNGFTEGKTLRDLANLNKSQFVRIIVRLCETLLGKDWEGHMYQNEIAKITYYDEGNPNTSMFNAQYSQCRDCFEIEQDTWKPYITFLFTGNTFCPNESIDWNELVWEYLKKKHWIEIDRCIWRHIEEKDCTISLFKADNRFFLELERPEGHPEQEHIDAIIRILRNNNVI